MNPNFVEPFSEGGGSSGLDAAAHAALGNGDIHRAVNWVVANAAARTALSVSAADLFKICWQTDTGIPYILTSTGPAVWTAIGGSSGGSSTMPAFCAYRTGTGMAIGAGVAAFTKIIFNAEEYDTDGIFDLPNSRFLATRNGLMHFNANLAIGGSAMSGESNIGLFKNSALCRSGDIHNSGEYSLGITADIPVVIGDEVTLRMYSQTSTSIVANSVQTYFQGRYVQ